MSAEWICCQLGAREHYAVARAIHRHGALKLLLTDAWIRPNHLLGLANSRVRARFHPELVMADVDGHNAANIGFELRSRLAGLRGWDEDAAIKFLMTGIAYNDLHARPPMPPYRLNRQDAEAIVAFLKSLSPVGK